MKAQRTVITVTQQTENRYFSSSVHFFRGKGQGEKGKEKTEGEEEMGWKGEKKGKKYQRGEMKSY